MTPADRNSRVQIGHEAEWQVLKKLMFSGRHYRRCGQESWLPKDVHDKLRFIHGNPIIDAVRHFPDYYCGGRLIEVKSAATWAGHPTVTIEKPCFEVCKELSRANPVLIVWYFPVNRPNEKEMMAQYADRIVAKEYEKCRHETNGSHTPMVLVPLSDLTIDFEVEIKKDIDRRKYRDASLLVSEG